MNFTELLPDEICVEILSFLDAHELSLASLCSRSWRGKCNDDKLWIRHCATRGWLKYGRMPLDLISSWQSTPSGVTSALTSPTYHDPELHQTSLQPLPKWKRVFLRAYHLMQNWIRGRYHVLPVLKGHKGKITALDSNGRVVVSGSSDKQLLIWDLARMVITHEVRGHSDSITAVRMISDQHVVTGCADGAVRLVDIVEGRILFSLHGQTGVEKLRLLDKETVACTHADRTIRVWSIKERKLCNILRGHTDEIECLEVHGRRILTGSWDCTLKLWEAASSEPIVSFHGHEEVVYCCQLDDCVVVSGSGDSTVKVWQTADGVCMRTMKGHKQEVHCVAFNSEVVASGGSDSLVIIWSWEGEARHYLKEHIGVVRCLYMNSERLVSAGDRKRIVVWDYRKGLSQNVLHRQPSLLYLMWCNETLLITASPDSPGTLAALCYW